MIIACYLLIEMSILGSLTRTRFTNDGCGVSSIFIRLGSCFVLYRMPCVTGRDFEKNIQKCLNGFFVPKLFVQLTTVIEKEVPNGFDCNWNINNKLAM